MANVSAISGAKEKPVAQKVKEFVEIVRKNGSSIRVGKALFKAYKPAENIEGIDTIELKNGVIVNILESTRDGKLSIDSPDFKKSESTITDIDGKEMDIEVDAVNKKVDLLNISENLNADVKIDQEDAVCYGKLSVSSK